MTYWKTQETCLNLIDYERKTEWCFTTRLTIFFKIRHFFLKKWTTDWKNSGKASSNGKIVYESYKYTTLGNFYRN